MIILGLGNPGEKFKNTPHNAGFEAIDKFAERNDFPDFKLKKSWLAEISEKENIILAKPQTFMNESGKAVKKILTNSPKKTADLIVVHDDIDLQLGQIKVVQNRGSAGHKGVESIIKELGSENFVRIRIGIDNSKDKKAKEVVLKKFSQEEKAIMAETIEKAVGALETIFKNGLEKAMQEYNK